MFIYAIWIILFMRPSWGLLNFFAAGAALLFALGGYFLDKDVQQYEQGERLILTAIGVALNIALFYAVGALIVWFRTRKKKPSAHEREVDEELARVRAEIAAREGQPPAAGSPS